MTSWIHSNNVIFKGMSSQSFLLIFWLTCGTFFCSSSFLLDLPFRFPAHFLFFCASLFPLSQRALISLFFFSFRSIQYQLATYIFARIILLLVLWSLFYIFALFVSFSLFICFPPSLPPPTHPHSLCYLRKVHFPFSFSSSFPFFTFWLFPFQLLFFFHPTFPFYHSFSPPFISLSSR